MSKRLRGLKAVVHDAVALAVDLVEQGHESVARNALRILRIVAPGSVPVEVVDAVRRASTTLTLDSIRAVNRLVEKLGDSGIDAAEAAQLLPRLERPATPVPMRSDVVGSAAWLADATLGALNGAVGDYLHREGNGLDLGFALRSGDERVASVERGVATSALSAPAPQKLAVFVHGLGTTEWSWCYDALAYHGDAGANFGAFLTRDLGYTPWFARYNSGLPVADNGRHLSELLEAAFREGAPADLVLVGHSMGGLVVQSALHYAKLAGHGWLGSVSRVFCLASPLHGAPLEKFGHALTNVLGAIDHPATLIPAALLRRRSAGIRDLRSGTLADTPLLDELPYYFVSATVTDEVDHPVGFLIGDVLVRVPSASGPVEQSGTLRIETACFGGIVHHQIQNHPDVYAWMRAAWHA